MPLSVGSIVSTKVTVTADMVQKFAEVSGDFNPIHLDDDYAKTTIFGRRIAHGMLSSALISRTLSHELDNGGIYLKQNLKFVNPIYIDEEVEIELKVLAYHDRRGIGSIQTIVRKTSNGDIVVEGEAMIMSKEGLGRKVKT
jgi:3-hydroxybutyryl-CoA dehydratase